MLAASVWPSPDTRASSGAEAVLTSTPTRVDAVLDHRIERAGEPGLVDVVLVLADADRLGLDLDQLGQRVLQAARDRDGAAQADVEVGELLGGELGRRIDRGARLRHHHLGELRARASWRSARRRACRSRGCGAVADADQIDLVLRAQGRKRCERAHPVAPGLVRIDRGGLDQLAGASTTATLTPVRRPGSSPMVTRGPAGAASSRSFRFCANTPIASASARSLRRASRSTRARVRAAPSRPGARSRQPASAGRPRSAMLKADA